MSDVAEIERAPADGGLVGRERWLPRLLVATVCLPFGVAVVGALFSRYQPVADWALIELRVRDVGADTPLLGPFSRYGWNHPGPLLFWGLALPYRLSGSWPESLLVGAGLVNLGSVLAVEASAWRRGRWPLLLLTSLGLAVLLNGVGTGFLVDPWNPYITMLPFAALLFVVWSIAGGHFRLTPLAVVLAAFLVETHVGYAPVVGALSAWALVGLALTRRRARTSGGDPRARSGSRPAPWLAGSAVLALALLAPMLVEQATNQPGNLVEIIRHFTSGDGTAAGLGRGARIVGQHLAWPGVWVTGDEPVEPFSGGLVGGTAWWAVPSLVLLGAAGWVAWRRRLGAAGRLLVTVGLMVAVGLVSVSRATDTLFPYLFQWLRPVAMALWVGVAWTAYLALSGDWRGRVGRVGGPLIAGATAVVTLVTCFSPTPLLITEGPVDDAVEVLAPGTIDAAGEGPVLIWPVGGCLDWVANGLVLELDRAGVAVRAPEGDAHRYGENRIYDGTNAERAVVVACGEEIDAFRSDVDFEEVAGFSPLASAEEEEFEDLVGALGDEARAEGRDELVPHIESGAIALFATDTGLDEGRLDRYRELQSAYGERVVVFVGPAAGLL